MKSALFRRSATALAALVLLATAAQAAQSVSLIGDFRDWSSYSTSDNGGPICFAVSKPKSVQPMPDGYTQAYLYITHRQAQNITNELNLVAGFNFAPDTPATLDIGGQDFPLFTENDAAWLEDPAQAANLAGLIRAGSSLSIEGTSDKGIKIVENFSLSGATAASRSIDGQC
ncbi:MAG TPA: hypothetical protein VGM83_03740 [Devosiaceae bacterium]|jgi:hypothetical protein